MAKIQTGKKVCLITPGHISSNPRLVKEALALAQSGYKVHLIFTQYVGYLVDHDQQILNNNPTWTYNCLNWAGQNLSSKRYRIFSKIMQVLNPNLSIKLNRNYLWQLKKAIACKADLYIAHNLSALPAVVIAAKKNNVKCGFDAEDFHRNEVSDDPASGDVKLKTAIEEKYIPQVDYMTAASPQIAETYEKLFYRHIRVVLNVFPKTASIKIKNNTATHLQLFWFSQTIGPGRGLEEVLKGIQISGIKTDLHLLGKVGYQYKQYLLGSIKNLSSTIYFHDPVYADELFKLAAHFDIGLASEPKHPHNRDICLTNKLFTYIQTGLAVFASNTTAQTKFIHKYPQTASLYQNADELAALLITHNNNRELLYTTKVNNFQLGQNTLNWEIEGKKFVAVIKNVLDQA